MKANWKQVSRGDVHPGFAGFYVTLNPKGAVHMNRVTHERLDSPEAFQVFFDEVNNRIGLKPSAKSGKDAFIAGRLGTAGGRQVRMRGLLNEQGIDLPATVRFYDADIDQDGVLVLDLRSARVHLNRHHAPTIPHQPPQPQPLRQPMHKWPKT